MQPSLILSHSWPTQNPANPFSAIYHIIQSFSSLFLSLSLTSGHTPTRRTPRGTLLPHRHDSQNDDDSSTYKFGGGSVCLSFLACSRARELHARSSPSRKDCADIEGGEHFRSGCMLSRCAGRHTLIYVSERACERTRIGEWEFAVAIFGAGREWVLIFWRRGEKMCVCVTVLRIRKFLVYRCNIAKCNSLIWSCWMLWLE